jgi:predicted AlkP superfamily phosphohydrolase/phosphomutase
MKRKLIIIGLDGATFDVIDPMLDDGQLPSMARLISGGVRARLLSTIPYATIPAWPSFMTGKNPGRHGVYDFFDLSGPKRRISNSQDVDSPTLWQILSYEGKRSVVLNVPATFPPTPINGVLVSGMLTPSDSRFASPPEVMDLLHGEADGYRVNFHSHLTGQSLVDDIHEVTEKQERAFLSLLSQQDWDFAMIMFRATDVVQHHFWGQQEIVRECYRYVDRRIGNILEAFGDAATFLVSDHGLQGQYRDFHINKWLVDEGYMYIQRGRATDLSRWEHIRRLEGRSELAESQLRPSYSARLLLRMGITGHSVQRLLPRSWWRTLKNSVPRRLKNHIPASNDLIYDVDWDRTRASAYQLYATESKAIKILNLDDRSRETLCAELVDRLEQLRDPDTGAPIVRRAHRREDLYSGPHAHQAPDIVLDLHDGYNITNAFFADNYVTPRDEVRGCHHREGIFVAFGDGVARGKSLTSVPSLMDVMPTALHYLGAGVPADCDGRVLREIFDHHSEPAERSPRYEAMEKTQALVAPEGILRDEEEAEIEERLRALGYL